MPASSAGNMPMSSQQGGGGGGYSMSAPNTSQHAGNPGQQPQQPQGDAHIQPQFVNATTCMQNAGMGVRPTMSAVQASHCTTAMQQQAHHTQMAGTVQPSMAPDSTTSAKLQQDPSQQVLHNFKYLNHSMIND